MLRVKELESKLELEQTTRSRIDVQCARYKESFEKAQSELQHTKTKELTIQDSSKKTQRSLRFVFERLNCSIYVKYSAYREAREQLQVAANREQDQQQKLNEKDKRIESGEIELNCVKNDLRLALQRIADLQEAMEGGDESSDCER